MQDTQIFIKQYKYHMEDTIRRNSKFRYEFGDGIKQNKYFLKLLKLLFDLRLIILRVATTKSTFDDESPCSIPQLYLNSEFLLVVSLCLFAYHLCGLHFLGNIWIISILERTQNILRNFGSRQFELALCFNCRCPSPCTHVADFNCNI